MREAEGLKLYSDVYTKLYDSYYKMKEENVTHQEKISSLKVVKSIIINFLNTAIFLLFLIHVYYFLYITLLSPSWHGSTVSGCKRNGCGFITQGIIPLCNKPVNPVINHYLHYDALAAR